MNAKVGMNPLAVNRVAKDALTDVSSTRSRTNSALDMKKQYGGKSLGEVLNQVADPNYSSQKTKVRGIGNAELGKDAFFKLMLTQLKQQDPTNPMKSHEMAAQLAQFTSVEQLTNMNETLTSMAQGKKDQFQVLNMIGKIVSGDSSKITRVKGDTDHKVEFQLPKAADTVVVKIKDATGKAIKTYELQDLKRGTNQIVWNGMSENGKDVTVGKYSAEIRASYKGQKLQVKTHFSGPVDGVQFAKGGALLLIGGKTMPMKDVQRIEIQKTQDKQKNQNVKIVDPNKKHSQGAVEKPVQLATLENVKMNSELRQKLGK